MVQSEKNNLGFSLSSNGVSFDFADQRLLNKVGDLYEIEAVTTAPTPRITAGDRLIFPIDEGIAIDANGDYLPGEFTFDCIHGTFCSREGTLNMIVVERKGAFLLIALDNGTHASYRAPKQDGLYQLEIHLQKPCKIRYGIFSSLALACQCYRSLQTQKFLTLTQKIERNPNLQKLIGGGIFWVWNNHYDDVMYAKEDTDLNPAIGEDLLTVADDLFQSGVKNAMFGLFFNADSHLSEPMFQRFGYLCTQYDNYNDVLNPALLDIVPNNRVKNCDYTFRRLKDYPDGIQVKEDGSFYTAWQLKGFDGKMHDQNTLCPIVAAERIRKEIPEILKEFPYYKGRFIDVFGGWLSPCYAPDHPLDLDDCLRIKRDAFLSIADMGLIVGTEDGFQGLLDGLDYVEGLHSPVYFRNRDSGRNHAHYYDEVKNTHINRYMLNPACRVPLWHLVYHDCLLAFPYWGDSTEMSLDLLWKKVLFACLYGCPPLYSFFVKDYALLKDNILESYRKITAVHQKVALLPMTDYAVLTEDHQVQKSVFGGRYEVIVNFSETPYVYQENTVLPHDLILLEL